MRERLQAQRPVRGEPESSPETRGLPSLIASASTTFGRDRTALAGEINALLGRMRAPGHEAEEAKVVLTALEQKALHDLVDVEGRSCRKEAVETLLATGF